MRTFRYHRDHPDGVIFDTTGETAPLPPPELNGWMDSPAKIHITQDQMIAALVRKELASQDPHRIELEREFKAKTGATPAATAKDSTLIKVLDEPLARRRK